VSHEVWSTSGAILAQVNDPIGVSVRRLASIRTLIDHPGTPEEERAAAQHRLDLLLARRPQGAAADAAPTASEWTPGFRLAPDVNDYLQGHTFTTFGDRYDSARGYADITTAIRSYIKAARALGRKLDRPAAGDLADLAIFDPLGTAPDAVRFRVTLIRNYRSEDCRAGRYLGAGASIAIRIEDVPDAWGAVEDLTAFGRRVLAPTPALSALVDDVRSLAESYNRRTTWAGRNPVTGEAMTHEPNALFRVEIPDVSTASQRSINLWFSPSTRRAATARDTHRPGPGARGNQHPA
jgi:hypothetical protein